MSELKQAAVRWTSRQFIVAMFGISLVWWATMEGKDVGPLAGVVTAAIIGAAGVNAIERRGGNQR